MESRKYTKYDRTGRLKSCARTGSGSVIGVKLKYPGRHRRMRTFVLLALAVGSIFAAGCSANRSSDAFGSESDFWAARGEEPYTDLEKESLKEGQTGKESSDAPDMPESEPGYVYVCGAVVSPGVYEIEEGTRVFEVIEQAGGLTEEADAQWLNQAAAVLDGQKLQIYTKEETAAFREAGMSVPGDADQSVAAAEAGGAAQADQSTSADDKVNINTADKELLMTLPGIGESKAEAILSYRQDHGNFGSIGDICQVSGIKEAVFSRIEDRITV